MGYKDPHDNKDFGFCNGILHKDPHDNKDFGFCMGFCIRTHKTHLD